MSGIAGFIDSDSTTDAAAIVSAMAVPMAYRGPDGIHFWGRRGQALAFCRLCTTAESLVEQQPLCTPDADLVLVADARLDNREELAAALGSSLQDGQAAGDAAMILAAFQAWGEGCVQRLEGDYAFAVWQVREQRLFLARDRVGHKPLFYRHDGNTLAFASDIAALLALPGQGRSLNRGVLVERMAAEWHSSDETLWNGIKRLEPAHTLSYAGGHMSLSGYWSPDYAASLEYACDRDYVEHYAELLQDTVRRQSRCHLPLACEVSGGLDSSAVFAVARRLLAGKRLQARGLQGFTLDCSADADADEIAFVRMLATHQDFPIREIQPLFPETNWFVQRLQAIGEFPEFPNNVLMLPLLDAATAAGSRVILNGMGGDEWLWGSRRYYTEELAAGHWTALADCLRADLRCYGPFALWWLLVHGLLRQLPAGMRESLRRMKRSFRRKDPLAAKPWFSEEARALLQQRQRRVSLPRTARAGQEEMAAFVRDPCRAWVLELGERMYAARGLEARSPMNTARMIEFAVSIPERMKLRGKTHKFVHVEAMQGMLPEALRTRVDKAEFSTACIRQLEQLGGSFRDPGAGVHREWLEPAALAALYAEFCREPRHAWRNAWLWHAWLSMVLLDSYGGNGENTGKR